MLVELWRICSYQTGKPLARSVDHEQIAIGTVIPAQANVSAGALVISGIHLKQSGQSQKARERVIGLEAAE